MFHGGSFFKKGGGTPNLFTVSQMPFFRSFISKVCQKNKVSEGISKKRPPWPPEAMSLFDFRVEQGVEEEFIGSVGLGPVLTAKADKNNTPLLIFDIH